MAAAIPQSMQAIALTKFCKPKDYDFGTLPIPEIKEPTDILIKVHAASINPVDVKLASGLAKALKSPFPYLIGYDLAGVVVATGNAVQKFKIGDEVYSRVPQKNRGTVAEYAVSAEYAVAKKPTNLSFAEAAAVPLAALTALQSIETAEKAVGSLKEKTVLIPAGLSGTGSFAIQLAKNVFDAGEVITTLSTAKIAKAKELLGENVFTPLDYTKDNVAKSIGAGKVDFLFDTMAGTISLLKTMKKGGSIVSISTIPPGSATRDMGLKLPSILIYAMDFIDWGFRWWCGRASVSYHYQLMNPSGADLERLGAWIEEGKITPIVGRTAKFSDLEGIRAGCTEVLEGKGGIGKFVIEIV